MICRNCGAQLSNNEQVCPICGSSLMIDASGLQASENMVMPQETLQGMHQSDSLQEIPQSQPISFDGGVVQPSPEKPKKDGKVLAIILAMAAVIIIGIGVMLALSSAPTAKPEENQNDAPVESAEVEYSGYKFVVPSGYKTSISSKDGLVLKDDSMMYTVMTDYTNSYETYKTAFLAAPEEVKPALLKSGEREYVVASLTGPEGENAIQYMTSSEDNTVTFVGLIIQSDYQLTDVKGIPMVLNKLIESAQAVDSDNKSDLEDAGSNGIVNYIGMFNKNDYVISEAVEGTAEGTEEKEEE